MTVISDDMVLIAQPTIPCRRVLALVQTETELGGQIITEVDIVGQVFQTVNIQGTWQRCPALDNTP